MAVAMTFKVTWRIARPLSSELLGDSTTRWALLPAMVAAAVAAASLFNSPAFITDNALGYSEGLMAALVLVAIDRHLDGARRQAFVVGFFAALDRPELWLLWGPYGLYLWWQDPGARKLVAGLFLMIPVLWFLPELWGSGHLFRGVTRAHHPRSNSPAFAKCPFCTEFVHHAWPRVMFRVKVVGLIALAVAAWGLWRTQVLRSWRRGTVLTPSVGARGLLIALGAIGWLWWLGVSVETQSGLFRQRPLPRTRHRPDRDLRRGRVGVGRGGSHRPAPAGERLVVPHVLQPPAHSAPAPPSRSGLPRRHGSARA